MKKQFFSLLLFPSMTAMLFTACKKEAFDQLHLQPQNTPPVACAGSDQKIYLPANSVELNGSGTDADGSIVSYEWTKVTGPSLYTFTSVSAAKTEAKNLVEGVYEFQLKVFDNEGLSATDRVFVFIIDPMNDPCSGCWDY